MQIYCILKQFIDYWLSNIQQYLLCLNFYLFRGLNCNYLIDFFSHSLPIDNHLLFFILHSKQKEHTKIRQTSRWQERQQSVCLSQFSFAYGKQRQKWLDVTLIYCHLKTQSDLNYVAFWSLYLHCDEFTKTRCKNQI